MLKTINSDGSLKIALIGSAVPAGAVYNDGLAYAPDGSLYVKLTQGALSGQVYNGGLACTPDGAVYVANSTPAASATFRRGLLCRADGAVHVSDATVVTVRHDGGIPKDNAGRLFVGIPLAGLALATNVTTGVTSSGGFASAWADLSGNGRNLLQATGANQPIHLPFSGTKYGYLPMVTGNYFSSTGNSPTTNPSIRWFGSLDDWTPAAAAPLVSHNNGSTNGYILLITTGGVGTVAYTAYVGGAYRTATSSVATGHTDGGTYGVRADHDTTTGNVTFYTSTDGTNWNQLGTVQTITAGLVVSSNSPIRIGQNNTDTIFTGGRWRWSQVYADGVLDKNPNASTWSSGTTFTASTGETWTINSTGSKPAQIVDRASLLFDGAAHYMKCGAFTLNQPETVYLVGTQYVWNSGDYLFDGNALNGGGIIQATGTPQINLNAGSSVAGNTEMTLAARKVVCAVFNGASSSLQVTTGTATTGNAGSGNMGGFTLGAAGSNLLFGSLQANEALIYNVAHDAATRANVIRALMSKHGVA